MHEQHLELNMATKKKNSYKHLKKKILKTTLKDYGIRNMRIKHNEAERFKKLLLAVFEP